MTYASYCRLGVHVYASDIEVIREARKMIAAHHRRGREARTGRHQFYRALLEEHRRARRLKDQFRL